MRAGRKRKPRVTLPTFEDVGHEWDPGAQVVRLVRAPGKRAELREVGARARLRMVYEDVPEDGNGRRRRRQLHPIEDMFVRGVLTQAQRVAGLAVADAWEACQRTASRDLAEPRVDSSPKPDDRTVIQLEAQQRWARIARQIPRDGRAVVEHVCCEGRYLKDGVANGGKQMVGALDSLRAALDVLSEWGAKKGY